MYPVHVEVQNLDAFSQPLPFFFFFCKPGAGGFILSICIGASVFT